MRFAYFALLSLWTALASAAAISYTNFVRAGPIQIHILRIPRHEATLEFRSLHGGAKAVGRSALTEQLKTIHGETPLAAINGDFFQLEGAFAGDPRGLQIVDGRLISAPAGTCSFWIDFVGEPHMAITRSAFRVTWPDGTSDPLGLNGKCDANELELYTPDVGSTSGNAGRQIVLGAAGPDGLLQAGKDYVLQVLTIRDAQDTPISSGTFVLALGSGIADRARHIRAGATLKISTTILPRVGDAICAISGGPRLVIRGKQQRFDKAASNTYQHRSSVEKHPRSALGWSATEHFWVQVDGRSKESVGMTLNELGALMLELGCEEAMNLDGGGSSTLWFDGKVRNRPSDGGERPIANCLVVVRKAARN